MAEVFSGVTDQALDVGEAASGVARDDCGGIALFVGTVRVEPAAPGHRSERVVALEYDAHPELAPARDAKICEEAASKWDLRSVRAQHRTGRCELGEPTVVVACAAPHRADALEACRWIDRHDQGHGPHLEARDVRGRV